MNEYIAHYCATDAYQTYKLYLYFEWQRMLEEFYYAHGNGD